MTKGRATVFDLMVALWNFLILALAYGFGTGLSPYAPGTLGSLIGVVLFWAMAPLRPAIYAATAVAMFAAGIYICGTAARAAGASDPGFIVYDEIVGFLVAMYLMPRSWQWIVSGFVTYRVFDILKPWPIYVVEEQLSLGSAIMADDVIAGIYTFVILQTARFILRKNRLEARG
jgi:phosphatidylglycerophosphatase A